MTSDEYKTEDSKDTTNPTSKTAFNLRDATYLPVDDFGLGSIGAGLSPNSSESEEDATDEATTERPDDDAPYLAKNVLVRATSPETRYLIQAMNEIYSTGHIKSGGEWSDYENAEKEAKAEVRFVRNLVDHVASELPEDSGNRAVLDIYHTELDNASDYTLDDTYHADIGDVDESVLENEKKGDTPLEIEEGLAPDRIVTPFAIEEESIAVTDIFNYVDDLIDNPHETEDFEGLCRLVHDVVEKESLVTRVLSILRHYQDEGLDYEAAFWENKFEHVMGIANMHEGEIVDSDEEPLSEAPYEIPGDSYIDDIEVPPELTLEEMVETLEKQRRTALGQPTLENDPALKFTSRGTPGESRSTPYPARGTVEIPKPGITTDKGLIVGAMTLGDIDGGSVRPESRIIYNLDLQPGQLLSRDFDQSEPTEIPQGQCVPVPTPTRTRTQLKRQLTLVKDIRTEGVAEKLIKSGVSMKLFYPTGTNTEDYDQNGNVTEPTDDSSED